MNAKFPLVLSLAVAFMPISTATAQQRRAAPARGSVARSAPQFRGAAFRGAGFRGSAPVQRYNWGGNRFNNFSAVNRGGFNRPRTVINRNTTNWNRFNTPITTNRFHNTTTFNNPTVGFRSRTTNRFGNNWNGTNRFGSGFNRNGNWWRNGNRWNNNNWWWHHHHHDNDFIFFSAFSFPFFFDPWYPLFYSAYYPYYGYTPYYYDPYSYGYGYGYPNYPVYGDNGYSDGDYGYTQPSPGYDTGQPYDGGRTQDSSIVSKVQEQLAQEGYYKGSIDGVAGSRTYYAIRAYERDHHLRVDGEITDELLQEMGLR